MYIINVYYYEGGTNTMDNEVVVYSDLLEDVSNETDRYIVESAIVTEETR
jgi:hypothetical protein